MKSAKERLRRRHSEHPKKRKLERAKRRSGRALRLKRRRQRLKSIFHRAEAAGSTAARVKRRSKHARPKPKQSACSARSSKSPMTLNGRPKPPANLRITSRMPADSSRSVCSTVRRRSIVRSKRNGFVVSRALTTSSSSTANPLKRR